MRDSITVRVSIDPLLHQRFKDKARGEGRTMAWLIDQWIRRYVDGEILRPPEKVYLESDGPSFLDVTGTTGGKASLPVTGPSGMATPAGHMPKGISKADQAKGRSRK